MRISYGIYTCFRIKYAIKWISTDMWRQRLHIAFKTVVIFNWIVNIENKEKKYSIGKFNL